MFRTLSSAQDHRRLERLDRVASFRRNVLDGMRAALGRWKEHQAALRPGRRALAHLSNRRTSQAWCSWCALLVELARKEAALLCMLNAALRRGFRSWRAFHAQRQLMRRAASGLRHHSLRRCFSRWEGSAEARAEKARIMRGKLSIAFGMRRQEARPRPRRTAQHVLLRAARFRASPDPPFRTLSRPPTRPPLPHSFRPTLPPLYTGPRAQLVEARDVRAPAHVARPRVLLARRDGPRMALLARRARARF